MADELSIKDIITLFNNGLRTEEQLKAKLTSSEKDSLVNYIMDDLKDMDGLDDMGDVEDASDSDEQFEY